MRGMKRIVGWLVFVAALVGLGLLIHAGTPPTPRWHVPLGVSEFSRVQSDLTADGRVITVVQKDGGASGPVEVRDAANGELLLRAWEVDGPEVCYLGESP